MASRKYDSYSVVTPTGEWFTINYQNALDFYHKCEERPVKLIGIVVTKRERRLITIREKLA